MAFYSYAWKLDKETREQFLASAYGDSMAVGSSGTLRYYDYVEDIVQPREQVRRSKYGIVKYEPMWLKNYKLKTAPKENILGPEPLERKSVEPIDVGEFIASDFTDSLSNDSSLLSIVDSAVAVSDPVMLALDKNPKPEKKEIKYLYRYDPDTLNNVEQEYYNKYYGEFLIDYAAQKREQQERLNRATAAKQRAEASTMTADSTQNRGEVDKRKFSLRKDKGEAKEQLQDNDSESEKPLQEEGSEEGNGN